MGFDLIVISLVLSFFVVKWVPKSIFFWQLLLGPPRTYLLIIKAQFQKKWAVDVSRVSAFCSNFSCFDPILNLFANVHKLVLVSGTGVTKPRSSSLFASFLLYPFEIFCFWCFMSKNIFKHLFLRSFSRRFIF